MAGPACLRPWTNRLPKALVEVAGRPILQQPPPDVRAHFRCVQRLAACAGTHVAAGILTRDVGGTASTEDVTQALIDALTA
ncbi:hypothetical protein GCM10010276_25420 [Streptomyces longisporus]|uniref:Uncharacterized protein n=1 Tax=Streptomyces longisporus TaxID=1948 RepID=A0ABN3LLC6_STRLO